MPPETAFIAGSIALLAISAVHVSSVDAVIRELDWRTLLFLACTFCLVQAVTNTGLLQTLSLQLYEWFGAQLKVVSMNLLAGVGLLSSVLANTPVVAASITMVKGYLVAAEVVPEAALSPRFQRVAAGDLAGVRRDDVRRYPRRQRNADRRGRQSRRDRRRRAARRESHVHDVAALRLRRSRSRNCAVSALYVLGLFAVLG